MMGHTPQPPSRRTLVTGSLGAVALAATGTGGLALYRDRHEVPASYGLTVAMRSTSGPWRQTRELVPADGLELLLPGTRVLAGPEQERLLDAQEEWLGSVALPDHVPGTPRDLFRQAALDVWVLSAGLPMAVAGWSPMWRHAWPRDTAHVAVALHHLGDAKGATRQLSALASRVGRAARIEARYALDGGTPDDRPPQDDGFGWVLWAAHTTAGSWRGDAHGPRVEALVRHCAATLLTRLDDDGLPLPSPDYWELEADHLTLGTAAPLLVGLERAVQLLGPSRLRERCAAAAERMATRIDETFGARGWPREIAGGSSDTAVAFMLPPYRLTDRADLRAALDRAAEQMRRPNGGYAPGGGWREDGVAWTPETAVLAAAWATSEATRDRARETLVWLARHRTSAGSLPEKVRDDGSPAGPSPLAWTAAVTLTAGASVGG
ncbi:hypothetical protein [Janibacter terrae]|uniref:hypothetical protein n=1 Tax=Janibacter terrae TaxID=103817 RepID=UPI00146ED2D1|nr:hypothetical protein [Janibacter terrae]